MAINAGSSKIRRLIASVVLTGVLLSACSTAPSEASSESTDRTSATAETTETTETSAATSENTTSSATQTSQMESETTPSETENTTEETTDASDTSDTSETIDTSNTSAPSDTAETSSRDVGSGSFGFQKGDLVYHSYTDISMLIQPEDVTVYDYEARTCKCDWIDIFYVKEAFDYSEMDSSYRFLGFYDNDTSVTFSGYTDIGTWTTPKGSDLELYITEIKIISHNLEIRLRPANPSQPEKYNVSICGRGYYASAEQLQMMDVVLSALHENPGVDPLEGIVPGISHTYYF
ncbi:hypothetical protein [Butyrivibrio sp. AE2032]|uniref:hypothetical protein n=1 Tax=Butyrivibrio sp. AE2032 TaxID=1458463 RepID=UPI00163A51A1|nr:hypothetical protein [Butyrivibrio sp. AE2032]